MIDRYLIKSKEDWEIFKKLPIKNIHTDSYWTSYIETDVLQQLKKSFVTIFQMPSLEWRYCLFCDICKGCRTIDKTLLRTIDYDLVEKRRKKLDRIRNAQN